MNKYLYLYNPPFTKYHIEPLKFMAYNITKNMQLNWHGEIFIVSFQDFDNKNITF